MTTTGDVLGFDAVEAARALLVLASQAPQQDEQQRPSARTSADLLPPAHHRRTPAKAQAAGSTGFDACIQPLSLGQEWAQAQQQQQQRSAANAALLTAQQTTLPCAPMPPHRAARLPGSADQHEMQPDAITAARHSQNSSTFFAELSSIHSTPPPPAPARLHLSHNGSMPGVNGQNATSGSSYDALAPRRVESRDSLSVPRPTGRQSKVALFSPQQQQQAAPRPQSGSGLGHEVNNNSNISEASKAHLLQLLAQMGSLNASELKAALASQRPGGPEAGVQASLLDANTHADAQQPHGTAAGDSAFGNPPAILGRSQPWSNGRAATPPNASLPCKPKGCCQKEHAGHERTSSPIGPVDGLRRSLSARAPTPRPAKNADKDVNGRCKRPSNSSPELPTAPPPGIAPSRADSPGSMTDAPAALMALQRSHKVKSDPMPQRPVTASAKQEHRRDASEHSAAGQRTNSRDARPDAAAARGFAAEDDVEEGDATVAEVAVHGAHDPIKITRSMLKAAASEPQRLHWRWSGRTMHISVLYNDMIFSGYVAEGASVSGSCNGGAATDAASRHGPGCGRPGGDVACALCGGRDGSDAVPATVAEALDPAPLGPLIWLDRSAQAVTSGPREPDAQGHWIHLNCARMSGPVARTLAQLKPSAAGEESGVMERALAASCLAAVDCGLKCCCVGCGATGATMSCGACGLGSPCFHLPCAKRLGLPCDPHTPWTFACTAHITSPPPAATQVQNVAAMLQASVGAAAGAPNIRHDPMSGVSALLQLLALTGMSAGVPNTNDNASHPLAPPHPANAANLQLLRALLTDPTSALQQLQRHVQQQQPLQQPQQHPQQDGFPVHLQHALLQQQRHAPQLAQQRQASAPLLGPAAHDGAVGAGVPLWVAPGRSSVAGAPAHTAATPAPNTSDTSPPALPEGAAQEEEVASDGEWFQGRYLGGTTGQPGRVGRCQVCLVQRKGRCGTLSAPATCLRRLALEDAGLPIPDAPPKVARKGGDAGPARKKARR